MEYEGGCFCRSVRYRAEGSPLRVMHCHCSICRRTSAAPFVTWITFPVAKFTWTKGKPSVLKSTEKATRYYCSQCGSHMAFTVDGAKELDVTVGSLDHAETVKPNYHIFSDTRMPWMDIGDSLPRYDDWGPDL
jgi:hypothetical protein